MPATKTKRLPWFILFVLLQANYFSFSQTSIYPFNEWIKKLARNAPPFSGAVEVFSAMSNEDSAHAAQHFKWLESRGDASNRYFTCRFNVAKATYWRNHNDPTKLVKDLMTKNITVAYETENDSLISSISWQYGMMNYWGGEIQLASMYCLNAAEIDERIGRKILAGSSASMYSLLN